MYCIKCGKQIPDSAQFCPFCGQACPAADRQAVPTDTPSEDITPGVTADIPATTEVTAPEAADNLSVPESPKEESAAALFAQPEPESSTEPAEPAPSAEPAEPAPSAEPAEPVFAASDEPVEEVSKIPASGPVPPVTDPAEKKQPLLKWIFIGLGAVACVALVLVIWSVASHSSSPSPSIKTVTPQSSISGNTASGNTTSGNTTSGNTTSGNTTQPGQTPSSTPNVTVPGVTPKVTVPNVTPKVTVPNVTPKVTVPNVTPKVTVPSTIPKSPEDATPKEGETLYVGHSSYSDISDVKLRFILSADKTQIHDVSITCEGLSGKIQNGTLNANLSISKITQMFQGQYPVNYNGTTTGIKLGSSTITNLTFSGETARAELDYTYHMNRTGTNTTEADIPFGKTWFDMTTEK